MRFGNSGGLIQFWARCLPVVVGLCLAAEAPADEILRSSRSGAAVQKGSRSESRQPGSDNVVIGSGRDRNPRDRNGTGRYPGSREDYTVNGQYRGSRGGYYDNGARTYVAGDRDAYRGHDSRSWNSPRYGHHHASSRGPYYGYGPVNNSWYVYSRHRIGEHVRYIPSLAFGFAIGGSNFFYSSGFYYRPIGGEYVVVRAPLGATLHYLPYGYRTLYAGSVPYYYFNDDYYWWDGARSVYVVVDPPAGIRPDAGTEVAASEPVQFVYPAHGQDATLQSRDEYECYLWALDESGFDPSRSEQPEGADGAGYWRARAACLEGRGYTVR